MKKLNRIIPLALYASLMAATACDDEISTIGSSLTQGEIEIIIDTLALEAPVKSIRGEQIDTRSTTTLVGRLQVPEYGSLTSSFVARLMCASSLNIPDTIPLSQVDSIKLLLRAPRSLVTGDSLAPQQMQVFELTKQLPADLTNQFDPTGYYDPDAPLGTRSYSLSALGMNDSIYKKASSITIPITLPREMAQDIVRQYREDPSVFSWPSSFAEYFPGLYVRPSFGQGAIANISSADFNIYYSYPTKVTVIEDNEAVTKTQMVTDSVAPFAMAPEVLSSSNITYQPSVEMEARAATSPVLAAPAGYNCALTFPTRTVVEKYFSNNASLTLLNNLTLSLPVDYIENDFGLTPPPYVVMVRTSELKNFFEQDQLPDDVNSFWASYSSASGSYEFTNMRGFLLPILEKGREAAMQEPDTEFTIVPVLVEQESYTDSYGNVQTVLVRCVPYISRPVMGALRPEDADVVLTFSYQKMLQ